jgi:malate dehydrogenase (oxaloacetate-decarboxylating)
MDTFEIHSQNTGKLTINSVIPVNDRETLSNIYTPNVGKICMAIKDEPELLKKYTIAGKTVAVISDGTAVLGFGNIGAKAALPVMEGKCVIFKEFAGIDAYPLCIEEQDPEKFIAVVKSLAMNFAAINLEDISAPKCFDIEKRLSDELNIPIIHDDQHGTAIVCLAALLGAVRLTGKKQLKIVVSGAGAAGTAITKLLLNAKDEGLLDIAELKVFDSQGLISTGRNDINKYKIELAELTGQTKTESFEEGIKGMDVFIGVSVANSVTQEHVKSMNTDPIVFALANPTPEIMPDVAKEAGAFIVATGRSDFPNQINNALAYPGVFKGLLAAQINKVTPAHKIAAAKAIFEYNLKDLSENQILPSILDKNIPSLIAKEIVRICA